MVDYLLRSAIQPNQPRPSIETLLHAFVPATARRPHAPRRDHRADVVARRPAARRGGVRRRDRSGSTTSGRASTCPGASPSCSRRTRGARAVLLEKHGLVTWGETHEESYRATIEFVTRAAQVIERARSRSLRARRLEGRRARRRGRRGAPDRRRCPRCAARSAVAGVILEVDRSPEAVAFASSAARARGQPGRRALPRPPDQHQAPAARGRVRPVDRRRGRAARGLPPRRRRLLRLVPRVLRAQPRRRDPAVPDRSGRAARRARPGRRHRHVGHATRAGPGSRATSTTARSRCRTRPTRSAASARSSESEAFAIEYWPLERYKLAQAPPRGELAGRVALITGARERHRPRDRPAPRRARRARRRRRPQLRGRADRRRRAGRRLTGCAAASPSRST